MKYNLNLLQLLNDKLRKNEEEYVIRGVKI